MADLTIIRMPDGASRYDLVVAFLKLRKEVFIDRMDWPLYRYEAIEFEQYDTFNAVYIVACQNGEVIGGARLIRTDQRIGMGEVRYSYMIRDAYYDLLPGMPSTLCYDEPPSCPEVWELTRLVTLRNTKAAQDILRAANDFLKREGAEHCLFLGSPAFLRMAKGMGFQPKRLGPIVRNDDGAFLAFSCEVMPDDRLERVTYVEYPAAGVACKSASQRRYDQQREHGLPQRSREQEVPVERCVADQAILGGRRKPAKDSHSRRSADGKAAALQGETDGVGDA